MQKLDFWKATKENKGAALIFNTNEEGSTFVQMFPQTGEKQFNYDARINASLGLADLGAIMAVLRSEIQGLGKPTTTDGKTTYGGLVHSRDNGALMTFINMYYMDDGRLVFGLSAKNNGETRRYTAGIGPADKYQLVGFVQEAIIEALRRNAVNNNNNRQNGGGGRDEEPAAAPVTAKKPVAATTTAPNAAVPKKPTVTGSKPKQAPPPVVEEVTEDEEIPI
jgi:hypothetical protein